MRVIAGKAKGKPLLCQEGDATRPSSDYFRELLFDCLQFQIADTDWLDLFAGTGAISIEAISRGAKSAVLVEKDPKAARVIQSNLMTTGSFGQSRMLTEGVETAIVKLAQEGKRFDFIFMDPPYNNGFEDLVLSTLPLSLLKEDGKLIIESDANTAFSADALKGWEIYKEKKTRRTKMTFLRRV